ncbi:hypothetical protein KEM55_002228 [Ascosphaera atra]|nr:hypothetical protein KEM55_002228 [Ascosphaera atra]
MEEEDDHDAFQQMVDKAEKLKEAQRTATRDTDKGEDATLKYRLLGASLTKAGQKSVDQQRVSEIIYNATKDTKYFNHEKLRDAAITKKIERLAARQRDLESGDLTVPLRHADAYVAELEATRDLTQVIVHADCDAFFAAVEELERPELRDVPMAVGKGVLTTCNYQARKFGVRSGMASFIGLKLCPELVLLPTDYRKYSAKAREIRAVMERYDPNFQSASIDEAYLNITDYLEKHLDMSPEEVVQKMRDEIREETKITVSAGIGPNARIAKICSNWNKPNGQYRVQNDRQAVMDFMSVLPVRKVNGIGRVFERELGGVGIQTCGDLLAKRAIIVPIFGHKAFAFLMEVALGLGRTCLVDPEPFERKSIGYSRTFRDTSDMDEIMRRLRSSAENLAQDMEEHQVRGKTVVLTIKLDTFEVHTRQTVPPHPISSVDEIFNHGLKMLKKVKREFPNLTLRLLGLRCTGLIHRKSFENSFFARFLSAKDTAPPVDQEMEEYEERASQALEDEIRQRAEANGEDYQPGADWANDPHEQPEEAPEADFGASVPDRPPAGHSSKLQETYTCPICGKQEPADDLAFNQHIDYCLSKDAIKEALENREDSDTPASAASHQGQRSSSVPAGERPKRKAGGEGADGFSTQPKERPRKRLFFA